MSEVESEDVEKLTSARIDERNKELEDIKNEIQNLSDILSSDNLDVVIEEEIAQPKDGMVGNIGLVNDPFNVNGLKGISKQDYDSFLYRITALLERKIFEIRQKTVLILN